MNILKLSDVNSYYGKSHILFNVSLTVRKGEVTALLGRNGVGKTTTLRTIMNLVTKRTGEIIFKENVDLIRVPTHKIAKLGISYVPDHGGIFPNLTVEENLKISVKQGVGKGLFDMKTIFELFPQLKDFVNRAAGTLSGGERRMLGIAKGLLLNPELLLIDEPSEGLAPRIIRDIIETIKRIQKHGVSVLLTSPNLLFVEKTADRIYVMDKIKER